MFYLVNKFKEIYDFLVVTVEIVIVIVVDQLLSL
jgi:hypothetical protein